MRVPHHVIRLLLIVGMFLAACTNEPTATPAPTADVDPTPSGKPTIRLVANAWVSSELNVEIAGILLENELGYPVEILNRDENEQWQLLADGDAHASLEVWPSGHLDNVEQYIIADETVENGGELGVVGKIGWYIPSYLLNDYPQLATWEGLQDAQVAALFSTEETGDAGRFLAGDASWVQYDADIINNLELNLQVVSVGTEEQLLAELEAAYSAEEPILLYFWTPHWGYILYDLAQVSLPPYSDECYDLADTGGVACDYPEERLFKIFSAGLADYAPEAHQFLSNFSYSNNLDQIALMALVHVDGMSVADAAQQWVDENEAIWREWIP